VPLRADAPERIATVSRTAILDLPTTYWVTNTGAPSARLYCGHFPAWEQPAAFVRDVRASFGSAKTA
jgi:pimeloyl-ACP methyl ester carboxylesterase